MNGELVDTFKGPVTCFGSMVEYHPVFAKDQSRLNHTNSARKFYPWSLLRICIVRGEILQSG